MIRSLWSGATGMIAQQTNLDVISNNLANVNTSGYKKMRADFEDLLYQIDRSRELQSSPIPCYPQAYRLALARAWWGRTASWVLAISK